MFYHSFHIRFPVSDDLKLSSLSHARRSCGCVASRIRASAKSSMKASLEEGLTESTRRIEIVDRSTHAVAMTGTSIAIEHDGATTLCHARQNQGITTLLHTLRGRAAGMRSFATSNVEARRLPGIK